MSEDAIRPAKDAYTRNWSDVTKDACHFYHSMDLPDGETVHGQWDLRGRIDDYLAGAPVQDRRVLDIGAASGFLSFEMERLGASEVVSFDADDSRRIAFLPVKDHLYMTDRTAWRRQVDAFLTMLKNGYWYCHKRLGSKAVVAYGDVYELPDIGFFETVVLGQILVHLRDPFSAIGEASRVCLDTLVIVEGVHDSNDTVGKMHARAESGGPPYIWWQLSIPLYKEILAMCGFELKRVSTARYLCRQHEYMTGDIEVATLVAKRR